MSNLTGPLGARPGGPGKWVHYAPADCVYCFECRDPHHEFQLTIDLETNLEHSPVMAVIQPGPESGAMVAWVKTHGLADGPQRVAALNADRVVSSR
jgi:hypothetical protein